MTAMEFHCVGGIGGRSFAKSMLWMRKRDGKREIRRGAHARACYNLKWLLSEEKKRKKK